MIYIYQVIFLVFLCIQLSMSKNITVGIDIGSYSTRVMVVEHSQEKGRNFSKIIGVGKSTSKGMHHGYIVNTGDASESLEEAVTQAETQSGIRIRQALVSVNGIELSSHIQQGSSIISRADNEVSDLDVQKSIDDAESKLQIPNKEIIDFIPIEYKLDSQKILGRPQGMKGIKLDSKILFLACSKQHIKNIIKTVNQAGIDVLDMIPGPLAASLVTTTERQRTAGCALLDIGSDTVSLSVFEDGTLSSLKVFGIGSSDITNDIAIGLRISLDQAEEIKKGILIDRDISQEKVEEMIEARLTDIFEYTKTHLKKIKRDGLLPAGIIIIGAGSIIPITEHLARNILQLPATKAVHNSSKKNSILEQEEWFVTYGLCMAGKYQTTKNNTFNPFKKITKTISGFLKSIIKQIMP